MAETAHVVLASASPRRLALLRRLGIEPVVRPVDVPEVIAAGEDPVRAAERLAAAKAKACEAPVDALVIGADTVVVVDGDVMGKPEDDGHAAAMLRRLSGRSHDVVTGYALRMGRKAVVRHERSTVTFAALSAHDIERYVATGEPADKAGAYAIQGRAGAFVTAVDGSDTNVIGLPLAAVVRAAREFGVELIAW